ncbi:hypothetical protein [Paracoccus onubensis]|nr:hypothetical protein [Paracoccus onubensis]
MLQISKSENLVIQTGFYTLEAFVYDDGGPLVVTFEHLRGQGRAQHRLRSGWMVNYLRTKRVSHLAVKPGRNDWYRRQGLTEAFQYLKDSGFLDRFARVITCGGSMGGYGALAYSGMLDADTVVAFNPLTTLNSRLVPWETRFQNYATNFDWDGPFHDAAKECASARQVYAVVDRCYDLDWKHVARMPSHNLHVLNAPFLQHQLPLYLHWLGLLEPFFDNMVQGRIETMPFNKVLRDRRELAQYFNVLENAPRVRSSPVFSGIVRRFKQESPLMGS